MFWSFFDPPPPHHRVVSYGSSKQERAKQGSRALFQLNGVFTVRALSGEVASSAMAPDKGARVVCRVDHEGHVSYCVNF